MGLVMIGRITAAVWVRLLGPPGTVLLAALVALCTLVGSGSTVRAAAPVSRTASAQPAAMSATLTTAQALARARATGKTVPVDGATTQTDTVVANPNGTLTLTRTALPVRKRTGSSWAALNSTLRRNPDGSISPAVSASSLTLSAGGTGPVAMMVSAGRSLAISLPMPLPTPTLSGAVATYAGVLRGVDLQVTADAQGGFSAVLVVHSRAAAANPALKTLQLTAKTIGVTLSADPDGNLAARDHAGRALFTAPSPTMWDSAAAPGVGAATTTSAIDARSGARINAHTGQPVASSAAGPGDGAHVTRVAVAAGPASIALTPDQALLTGPGTVFPVYIDPTFTPSAIGASKSGWASISEYFPSSNYWDNTPDPQGYMQVGNSGSMWSHTLINFPIDVATLRGASILSAELNTTEVWSYSCTPSTVNVYAPATTLTSSNATWNAWAGVNLGSVVDSANVAYRYNSTTCPAHGVGFNVLSAITADVAANKTTQTFALLGVNESNDFNSWKEFLSGGTGAPTLQITYNHPPNTPSGLSTSPATSCTAATPTTVGDGAVYLYAPVSDPDGGSLGVAYGLWKTSAPGTLLASSNSNTLIYSSGTTAVLVVPEATLKTAAAGAITEFSWHVQVTDFLATSAWSVTCNFNFDPTRAGAPSVASPGSTTIGQPTTLAISPPASGATPTGYLYQLNGAAPGTVTTNSGSASITIKPTRFTNVLSVTSLSAGGNIGDTATVVFNSTPPATPQADQDLTGDNVPDLVTVGGQNGLPPGLWQAAGTTAGGQVGTAPVDIGANGNNLAGDLKPADFNGAQVITGHFTGTGLQDVLAYYPAGPGTGAGVVLNGNGDGSVLQAQLNTNANPINAGTFTDSLGNNPLQVANAGNSAGLNLAYPDLIATAGSPTSGYYLDYYPNQNLIGGYYVADKLTTATPAGGTDWNNWTITTCQVPGGTAMFLWDRATGALYLWTGLAHTPGSAALTFTQYTIAASGWNTGVSLSLQAADFDRDGTPDLWTVGAGGTVRAYVLSLPTTGGTATVSAQPAQTLLIPTHTWTLNDAASGTIAAAADTTGTLSATGSGDAIWRTGDLFSPDAALNTTTGGTGALSTTGPALATSVDFTLSAWVKPTATGGTVVSQDGTHASGFKLWTEPSDGSWRFAMSTSDSDTTSYDTAAGPAGSVTLGAWTHLTATYTQSTGLLDLSINGAHAASAAHTTTWNATGAFQIGDSLSKGTRTGYFSGQVADVETWALVTPGVVSGPIGGLGTATVLTSTERQTFQVRPDGNLYVSGQSNAGAPFGGWLALSTAGTLTGRPWALVNSTGGASVYVRRQDGHVLIDSQNAPGGAFGGWADLGGGAVGDPAAAITADGVMKVFAVAADGNLYFSGQSAAGSTFGPWGAVTSGGGLTGRPWAMVNAGGGAQVFVHTRAGAITAVGAAFEGASIGGQANLGAPASPLTGDPTAVITADGVMKVFDVAADGGLYLSGQSARGSAFGGWGALGVGTTVTGSPSATVNAGGGAQVAVRTAAGGAVLIGAAQEGGGINIVTSLGSGPALISDPNIVLDTDSTLKVFAGAADSNTYLTAQSAAGSPFGTWSPVVPLTTAHGGPTVLGAAGLQSFQVRGDGNVYVNGAQLSTSGSFVGRPWALVNASGGTSVFVRNQAGHVQIDSQNGAGAPFGGWADLGGALAGDPSAVITADGVMKVFGVGTDGNVYLNGQSSAGSSFGSWGQLDLGGTRVAGRPWALVNAGGGASIFTRAADGGIVGIGAPSEGAGIGGWTRIGAGGPTMTGDPAAVITADGVMKVFDVANDGHLYVDGQSSAGSAFGTWGLVDVGTGVSGSPSVTVNAGGGPEAAVRSASGMVVLVGAPSEGAAMGAPVVLYSGPAFTGDPELMSGYDGCMRAVATDSTGVAYVDTQASPNSAFGGWTRLA